METSSLLLNKVLEHRLRQEDIRTLLGALGTDDRDELFDKLSDMLGKLSALLEVSNKLSDSLDLDLLLQRLVEATTEAINAERGTIFLHDKTTDELFSRVASGDLCREIRFPSHRGIAGSVFGSGTPIIMDDAYADPRFNPETDKKTGYITRNMLTVPIRNKCKETVGALQLLNKRTGAFTGADLALLEAMASQAAAALQNAQLFEQLERARREEAQLFEVTQALCSELQLVTLLEKIMDTSTAILEAERSTLFLHDEKSNELWSVVAEGVKSVEIRFPSHMGIAGSVFTSGETVNIPDAYRDSRFNPEIDKKTNYRTRSILCAPVINKEGKAIGVTQVLNKKGGPFTGRDEERLKAFSVQAAIAIENARLFEDVLNMKNYNESILESLSNGVITMNGDRVVEKCNAASLIITNLDRDDVVGKSVHELFMEDNRWIVDGVEKVMCEGKPDVAMDAELALGEGGTTSVNLTAVPLINIKKEFIGSMLVFEDISGEKRLKGTLARYMTKEVADQLIANADSLLGGQIKQATILFSDIRRFTTLSEAEGPQETVAMLNEYFTEMVDIVFNNRGILDKYIGDALLAVFGAPFTTGRDADNGVKAAVEMMRTLEDLNRRRCQSGKAAIKIGIGINSDDVLVGNIGSLKRMDYTVIGDGVNLASRLEGATKYYGSNILISGSTLESLTDTYLVREVDLIRVRGKTKPVAIHEVLDYCEPTEASRIREMVGVFEEGLGLYRRAEWETAMKTFERALCLYPSDRLPRLYIERCRRLLHERPGPEWDCVWVMAEK